MRLIDADARVTVLSYDVEHEEYCCHNKMTVEQALDFATDEGCPPTIDAIPVEWLREFDLYYFGISGGSPYFRDLLRACQKEQEAANATDKP